MLRTLILAALIASTPAASYAKTPAPSCAQFLGLGQPTVTRPAGKTYFLCFRSYAVLASGQTRTPLWSAEHLTREAVEDARKLPRDSDLYMAPRPSVARRVLRDHRSRG